MRQYAIGILCAVALLPGCKPAASAVDGIRSAGSAAAKGVTGVATSLINVDLSNVLNDLALDLKVDKSNIPINAQIPISVAANVCGVSINILSIGGGGGTPQGCTANNASPELVQAVQQQLAAQGSVGGGAQSGGASGAPGTATPPTAPTGSAMPAAGTAGTATGTTGVATPNPGTAAPTTSVAPGTSNTPTQPLRPSSTTTNPAPTATPTPTPTPTATPTSTPNP